MDASQLKQLTESLDRFQAHFLKEMRKLLDILSVLREELVAAGVVRAECNCPAWMAFHAMNCNREDLAGTPQLNPRGE